MVVFKYIEDKDVFQKFYSKMLAKRLVQHMSASDDAEASMISKLKQACGFEYTSKLQRMFQDIGVSKDLNEQFRRHLGNSNEPLDIDFHIQVNSYDVHSLVKLQVKRGFSFVKLQVKRGFRALAAVLLLLPLDKRNTNSQNYIYFKIRKIFVTS
jgi:hypothetical protein